MTETRRRTLLTATLPALGAAAAAVVPSLAAAQGGGAAGATPGWPDRPIRVIAPSSAGGPTDAASRLIGQFVLAETGQPLVIDNRAGGGGTIGFRLGARAAPDGHTLTMGNPGPVAVQPNLGTEIGYDILNDFVPVALVMAVPISLVVRDDVPARSVAELIAHMRAHPGAVNFGSSGPGQTPHIAAHLLLRIAGVEAVVSPYRGAPPAVNDLLAGSIQAMFDTTTALPSVQQGRLRALAIGSRRRSALMPEIPTMAESGFEGFEISSWYVLLAPAGTPRPVVERLNAIVNRALADPGVRQRLAAMNAEPLPGTPEDAAAMIRAELTNWAGILRRVGTAAALGNQ